MINNIEIDDWDVIEFEVTRSNDPQTGVDKCFISIEKLKEEALIILKRNKGDINVADWIEFFNIEKEFADLCLNDVIGGKDE